MHKLESQIEKKEKNNRIFGLDILRAFAILVVVIEHGNYLLSEKKAEVISSLFGYDGVSIFFVLSGFLIGGILIKTLEKKQDRKHTLLNFWIRRWCRTIPNYFLILIVLLTLNLLFNDDFNLGKRTIVLFFTFTQNLFYEHPTFFSEAWSLSIEEWFYLLIPPIIMVFMFFKRNVKTSVLYTAISILIIITLYRFYRYSNIPAESLTDFSVLKWDMQFRKQVITRLDSLMFGVIGAFLQYYYKDYWLKHKKTLLYVGILLFIAIKFIINPYFTYSSLYYCVFSFSLSSFATLLLLPFLSDFRYNSSNFIHKSITKISLISYSMYLINLSLVQHWIIRTFPWDIITSNQTIATGLSYLSFWVLTIFLSMIIYKYFEVPFMNLRDNKKLKKFLSI